ncbi:MAG: glycosyltransferase [Treponema sp.]|uniref:glycosyltransferase n=1 Tax=Treponema sp. TaxID=166 RepID=UPI00298ECE77|nr:glycosyltransferase [Treponema sp.]MBR5934041.1 glycosyltransferase [Treponema sp.]
MKILQIGKFFPPYFFGGIETVSYALHEELQKVSDVTSDFLGFLPKNYKEDIKVNDHVYLCKTDIDKFSAQLSKSFFKKYNEIKNNYDIILVNMPHPVANLAIWLSPPKKNVKIVLYWHSDIVKQKKLLFFYRPFQNNLIKRSAAVFAPTSIHTSESDCKKLFAKKKFNFEIPFILNYKTKKEKYKLTPEGKKVIFACGRLIYYKGFEVLVEAAKYISDDAVVHISGTGPLKESLEKQIADNGLSSKVKLLGRLSFEDLQNEYKNCYLYCFPSVERGEMMGLVQYEALSYGKPIVSTLIPRSGAPTLNIEGITGFKVPVYDAKALSEKINLVLSDKRLYGKLCDGAVETSLKYNDSDIINRYIDAFKTILA